MKVTVRPFAILRERLGASSLGLELPFSATVADALGELARHYPHVASAIERCMVAVNLEYVMRNHRLHEGDELALIPPVSGGAW
ncbi:MAG: MoaD/ThiS family protein [Chloroflexi bacterium]|nr:MoaD/ThiS family protein [Chloroflexota bacterium]